METADVHELLRLCLQLSHPPLQFLSLSLPLLQTPSAVFQSRPCLFLLHSQCPPFLLKGPDAPLGNFQLLDLLMTTLCLECDLQAAHVLLPLSQLPLLLLQFLLQPLHQSFVISEITTHLLQGLLHCTTSAYLIEQLVILPQQMQFLCCSFVDSSKFVMFDAEVLVLGNPLVAQPFQPLVLFQQFQDSVITSLALRPLQEGLLSHCLHEGLQYLLLLRVQCQHALNKRAPARSESKIQYEQTGFHEVVAVGSDGGAFPADALLEACEVVVVKGMAQGSVGLAPPPVEH